MGRPCLLNLFVGITSSQNASYFALNPFTLACCRCYLLFSEILHQIMELGTIQPRAGMTPSSPFHHDEHASVFHVDAPNVPVKKSSEESVDPKIPDNAWPDFSNKHKHAEVGTAPIIEAKDKGSEEGNLMLTLAELKAVKGDYFLSKHLHRMLSNASAVSHSSSLRVLRMSTHQAELIPDEKYIRSGVVVILIFMCKLFLSLFSLAFSYLCVPYIVGMFGAVGHLGFLGLFCYVGE